jgi:hypothetical protein
VNILAMVVLFAGAVTLAVFVIRTTSGKGTSDGSGVMRTLVSFLQANALLASAAIGGVPSVLGTLWSATSVAQGVALLDAFPVACELRPSYHDTLVGYLLLPLVIVVVALVAVPLVRPLADLLARSVLGRCARRCALACAVRRARRKTLTRIEDGNDRSAPHAVSHRGSVADVAGVDVGVEGAAVEGAAAAAKASRPAAIASPTAETPIVVSTRDTVRKSIVVLLFLVWSRVVASMLDAFAAYPERIAGVRLLRRDLSVDMESGKHRGAQAAAGVGLLVYGLGIPLAAWVLLRRLARLGRLTDPTVQHVYGFTYASYSVSMWWWELVVVFPRKLFLAAALTFGDSAFLQLFASVAVTMVALCLQLAVRPLASRLLNAAETLSLAATIVVQMAMMLMQAQPQMAAPVASVILVVTLATVIVFVGLLAGPVRTRVEALLVRLAPVLAKRCPFLGCDAVAARAQRRSSMTATAAAAAALAAAAAVSAATAAAAAASAAAAAAAADEVEVVASLGVDTRDARSGLDRGAGSSTAALGSASTDGGGVGSRPRRTSLAWTPLVGPGSEVADNVQPAASPVETDLTGHATPRTARAAVAGGASVRLLRGATTGRRRSLDSPSAGAPSGALLAAAAALEASEALPSAPGTPLA